jgi:hypothetical protein
MNLHYQLLLGRLIQILLTNRTIGDDGYFVYPFNDYLRLFKSNWLDRTQSTQAIDIELVTLRLLLASRLLSNNNIVTLVEFYFHASSYTILHFK